MSAPDEEELDDLPAPRRLGQATFTAAPDPAPEPPAKRPRIPERTGPASHLSAVPQVESPKEPKEKRVQKRGKKSAASTSRYGFVGVSIMFTLSDLAWFESEVDVDDMRSQRSVLLELCAQHDKSVPEGPSTGRAALGLEPGRPPARSGERTVAVKVSMKEDERDVLDERATARNLSRSAYVSELIRAARSN